MIARSWFVWSESGYRSTLRYHYYTRSDGTKCRIVVKVLSDTKWVGIGKPIQCYNDYFKRWIRKS